MTTFSYTTGNPSNLTAGTTASMNDIQGPFTDLRTFLNGANLDSTNIAVNGVTANLLNADAVNQWRTKAQCDSYALAGNTNGQYVMNPGGVAGASGALGTHLIRMKASEMVITGKTPKLRVSLGACANATTPNANFSAALAPVTSASGGAANLSLTLGTLLGATPAIAPPAFTYLESIGAEFTLPTDGFAYVFSLTIAGAGGGGLQTSSAVGLSAVLELRWV
jgi:hypothetical protein